MLGVKEHVIIAKNKFVNEAALSKFIPTDFLFNTGKVCMVSHAIETLPDEIFQLEGSGTLTRGALDNLNKAGAEHCRQPEGSAEADCAVGVFVGAAGATGSTSSAS